MTKEQQDEIIILFAAAIKSLDELTRCCDQYTGWDKQTKAALKDSEAIIIKANNLLEEVK